MAPSTEKTVFRTAFIAMAVAGALGGFAPAAAAGPLAIQAGQPAQAGENLIEQAQYQRSPRRHYGSRPSYLRPHCSWSERRVWDGWRWAVRPVRVCR